MKLHFVGIIFSQFFGTFQAETVDFPKRKMPKNHVRGRKAVLKL